MMTVARQIPELAEWVRSSSGCAGAKRRWSSQETTTRAAHSEERARARAGSEIKPALTKAAADPASRNAARARTPKGGRMGHLAAALVRADVVGQRPDTSSATTEGKGECLRAGSPASPADSSR